MSTTKKITKLITNIIHEDTQFPGDEEVGYLTVDKVGKISNPGTLDFGGSEYTEADIEWIPPRKKSEDDKYGWWELDEGTYHVQFNEGLKTSEHDPVVIQIWKKALRNGVFHPTELITYSRDHLFTQLVVSEGGIGIKENARISVIRLL